MLFDQDVLGAALTLLRFGAVVHQVYVAANSIPPCLFAYDQVDGVLMGTHQLLKQEDVPGVFRKLTVLADEWRAAPHQVAVMFFTPKVASAS